jgi:hypothetical protein
MRFLEIRADALVMAALYGVKSRLVSRFGNSLEAEIGNVANLETTTLGN